MTSGIPDPFAAAQRNADHQYQIGRDAFRDGKQLATFRDMQDWELGRTAWLNELAEHVRQIERHLGLITLTPKKDGK